LTPAFDEEDLKNNPAFETYWPRGPVQIRMRDNRT